MPLTDRQIANAKPGPKRQRIFDGGGLYLEVTPAGGKWWRFKYRIDGKEKLLSLGTYPDTSLKDARARHETARKQVAAGVDPSGARKAEKEARRIEAMNSLEAVASAWLAERASAWKKGTRDAIEASLKTHVFPELGKRPAASIKPAEIRKVVKRIEAGGAAETSSRVFQRLRAIYRYALSEEIVAVDPTYSLKPAEIFRPRKVKHRAALAERDVPAFLRKLDAYAGDLSTRAALELLILTAVRPGELRGARWDEIDVDRALWRIPGSRMKMETEHLVPLSTQALAMLQQWRASAGAALVFPSPFYPGKQLSDGTLNSALARLGYKGIATAHGFRTLFSTCANEAGWNGDLIEKQLAHEERDDVRNAYNRAQYLAERRKLMQWWADHLDALRKGAEVLPFKAA
jgi:integrase